MFVCETCATECLIVLAPCPDGLEGCTTCHYDENSYVCHRCGHDNVKWVTSKLAEGIRMVVGVGAYNVESLARLDLFKG